ncbi:MAG TPA: hypothetical protein H9824_12195 [Candidatus Bacteroides pullicola]|uniref:Uncharacterized protein n=1 Tax=Candidatus Bacteroides pullicola TaxID=2838475 RepID=A0A9D1ZK43_9BACE|nr:hypothetical protein [Candidatus Bacteroides pullicola]
MKNIPEQKIDPEKERIGMTGLAMPDGRRSPDPIIGGKSLYRRIFIRLCTPQETLTCSPIQDGEDFARRASIIENWFNSVIRKGNYLLTFQAVQLTDEEADRLEGSV